MHHFAYVYMRGNPSATGTLRNDRNCQGDRYYAKVCNYANRASSVLVRLKKFFNIIKHRPSPQCERLPSACCRQCPVYLGFFAVDRCLHVGWTVFLKIFLLAFKQACNFPGGSYPRAGVSTRGRPEQFWGGASRAAGARESLSPSTAPRRACRAARRGGARRSPRQHVAD